MTKLIKLLSHSLNISSLGQLTDETLHLLTVLQVLLSLLLCSITDLLAVLILPVCLADGGFDDSLPGLLEQGGLTMEIGHVLMQALDVGLE